MKSHLIYPLLVTVLIAFASGVSEGQVSRSLADTAAPVVSQAIADVSSPIVGQGVLSDVASPVVSRGILNGGGNAPGGSLIRRAAAGREGFPMIRAWDRQGNFNRDEVYAANEDLPLGGLFAPDFELTANAFGGWNRIAGFGPETEGDNAFDDDFAVGFAYGRRHSYKLRSEFEFTYRSNDAETLGQVEVYSIMKNFLIDIEIPSNFATPYVGIGIGYANVDTDFDRLSGLALDNSGSFAWQPIAGVSIKLTEKLNYYFEYRYFSTTDLGVTLNGEVLDNTTYNSHNLFMGLRVEF